MQVDFYQLAGTAAERVVGAIAGKVLAGGDRLLVVVKDEAAAAALDEMLWQPPASFLPHGRAGEGDSGADQPVLIACGADPANGARNVALADGRWRAEALDFDRAFLLFDEAATPAARDAWRSLGEGVTRNYWSQDDDGRWQRRA